MTTDLAVKQSGGLTFMDALTDGDLWNRMMKMAEVFAASNIVPEQFRNNHANCVIAVQMSVRMSIDPFMLMQGMYVVQGRPGMESKLMISLLNQSGKINGTIRYDFSGEGNDYGCTAYVEDRHTGEAVHGPKVDWTMVKAEKWDGKNGSKWKSIPEMMFRYRAAAFLIRAHYPDVIMGMSTKDELDDISSQSARSTPASGRIVEEKKPATEAIADAMETKLAAKTDTVSEPKADTKSQSKRKAATKKAAAKPKELTPDELASKVGIDLATSDGPKTDSIEAFVKAKSEFLGSENHADLLASISEARTRLDKPADALV